MKTDSLLLAYKLNYWLIRPALSTTIINAPSLSDWIGYLSSSRESQLIRILNTTQGNLAYRCARILSNT